MKAEGESRQGIRKISKEGEEKREGERGQGMRKISKEGEKRGGEKTREEEDIKRR